VADMPNEQGEDPSQFTAMRPLPLTISSVSTS
jgi:hypothetical protein